MPKLGSDFICACEDVVHRYKLWKLDVFELGRWLGKARHWGRKKKERRKEKEKRERKLKERKMDRKNDEWKDICYRGKRCQGVRSFDRFWEVPDHPPGQYSWVSPPESMCWAQWHHLQTNNSMCVCVLRSDRDYSFPECIKCSFFRDMALSVKSSSTQQPLREG